MTAALVPQLQEAFADGLVLRDYKTGKAPKDDGGVFRGGRQLQIPFYVLAAERLYPQERVVEAFLDYVDGGRQVAFDPAAAGSSGASLTGPTVGGMAALLLKITLVPTSEPFVMANPVS